MSGLAIGLVTAAGLAGLLVPVVVAQAGDSTTIAARPTPAAPVTEIPGRDHQHATADPTPAGSAAPTTLAGQLALARRVAARWPTAADAVADGWRLAAPYSSHVGAHYLNFDDVDGDFDVAHPEMLLYGGDAPNSPIVGLTYYVLHREPAGFAGSRDRWHQHLDVCIGPGGPLVGADAVGICATSNKWPVGKWAWMLHAWVVPDRASPRGVFSAENPVLP